MKIRKNDNVIIIAGKDKGKKGKVLKVIKIDNKIVVEGVSIIKRHKKLNTGNKKDPGGIIEKPSPISVSNVMLINEETGKPVRVSYVFDKDGKKWRNTIGKVQAKPKEVKKVKVEKKQTKKVLKTKKTKK